MFVDLDIEKYPTLIRTGPGIGSPGLPNPTAFTASAPTAADPWLTVSTDGPAYADGEAATIRPVYAANTGLFTYAYTIKTSPAALTAAQALETTPRLFTADGWNYPTDFQNNYEEGGMIQIWQSASAPWVDTGIVVGKYTPNTPYKVEINYSFNSTAHTLSVLSFNINGKLYKIPTSMQNVAGSQQPSGWTPGIYIQRQLDLNALGGSFSVSYQDERIIYPGT